MEYPYIIMKDKPENIEDTLSKNIYFRNIRKYLRELSVVVVGIAITFFVSGWITGLQEKKMLKSYLQAVKFELEENQLQVEDKMLMYAQISILADYLAIKSPQDHLVDSVSLVSFYNSSLFGNQQEVVTNISTIVIKTSAFQMLKSSQVAHTFMDQELFRSILESYTLMEDIKRESDEYMSGKKELIHTIIRKNKMLPSDFDLLDTRWEEFFYFLCIPYAYEQEFSKCLWQIEKTLSLFGE